MPEVKNKKPTITTLMQEVSDLNKHVVDLKSQLHRETYLRERTEKERDEAIENATKFRSKIERFEGMATGASNEMKEELRRVWTLLRSVVGDKTLLEWQKVDDPRFPPGYRAQDPFFPSQDRF